MSYTVLRGLRPGAISRLSLAAKYERVTLDVIAMRNAPHRHREDLSSTVKSPSDYWRPARFLAVLYEPVRHDVDNRNCLADLRCGMNEQTFSMEDCAKILDRGHMRPDAVVVHPGSLKTRLRPCHVDWTGATNPDLGDEVIS